MTKPLRRVPAPPRKALLADDDDDMRALLACSLRRAGFQVIEACDGNELVHLFAALWAKGAVSRLVIVSDIGMPFRDGLTATRMVRATAPEIPVILVTAFTDHGTLRAARELGPTCLLHKPVNRQLLVQAALQAVGPARARG